MLSPDGYRTLTNLVVEFEDSLDEPRRELWQAQFGTDDGYDDDME